MTPVQEFVLNGMTHVPFDANDLIARAISGFTRFLEESSTYKEQWMLHLKPIPGSKDEPDEGYIQKNGESGDDCKSLFHYCPRILRELVARKVDFRRHIEWLAVCGRLRRKALVSVLAFAEEFDCELPMYTLKAGLLDPEATMGHKLRLVYYDRTGPESRPRIIGKNHFDRCCITLHLGESRPGMRIGGENGSLYKLESGKALLFSGKKFANRTGGLFRPMSHAAVNESDGVDPKNRWAVVFFSQTTDSDDYPDPSRHWSQTGAHH